MSLSGSKVIDGEGWLCPIRFLVMHPARSKRQGKGHLGYMVPTFSTFCQNSLEMKILGTLNFSRTTWTSSWPMSPTSPPLLVWPGQLSPTVCWTRCLWFQTWFWTSQSDIVYFNNDLLTFEYYFACCMLILLLKLDNNCWNGLVLVHECWNIDR